MSNEQKPSDADMALAREWAPSDPEWSLTVIAKRIARVRREARAEAFEFIAMHFAGMDSARSLNGHGAAQSVRALAAKERAS